MPSPLLHPAFDALDADPTAPLERAARREADDAPDRSEPPARDGTGRCESCCRPAPRRLCARCRD